MYTILKFIHNSQYEHGNPNSVAMISRTLGKIALPERSNRDLDPGLHNNTFWAVELLAETNTGNRGIIICQPLFQVPSTSLLPGMFTSEVQNHWVYLTLKPNTPIKAYVVPKSIKTKYLADPSSGCSVVAVPYDQDQIEILRSSL